MKILLALILIVPFILLGGWITMLCFGALSHIFNAPNLAIGFWPSLLAGLIINLLIGSRSK